MDFIQCHWWNIIFSLNYATVTKAKIFNLCYVLGISNSMFLSPLLQTLSRPPQGTKFASLSFSEAGLTAQLGCVLRLVINLKYGTASSLEKEHLASICQYFSVT